MGQPESVAGRTSAQSSDCVTLLVFKDNRSSRTFQLSLKWLPRLGAGVAILVAVTLVSTLLAARYYRAFLQSDPDKVKDLEQEISELKSNLKDASSRQDSVPISGSTLSPGMPYFIAFPSDLNPKAPSPESLPFKVQEPRVKWRTNTLSVHFALQYTKGDQGSQDGRILILARGPELLMAYPKGIFNGAGESVLINPNKGESFLVSRFREVNAEFDSIANRDAVKAIEIFVFNKAKALLYHDTYQLKQEAPRPPVSTRTPPSPSLALPPDHDTPPNDQPANSSIPDEEGNRPQ